MSRRTLVGRSSRASSAAYGLVVVCSDMSLHFPDGDNARRQLPAVCIEQTIAQTMREIVHINYLSIRDLDGTTFQVCRVGRRGRRCMMGPWPPSSTSMPIPTTRRPRPPDPWRAPPPRGTASSWCSRPTATTGRRRTTWPRARRVVDRRRREAAGSAAGVLGLARVAWLGYADSGMTGWEQNHHQGSFHRADLDEAAGRLAAILDEEDADVAGRLRLARRLRPPRPRQGPPRGAPRRRARRPPAPGARVDDEPRPGAPHVSRRRRPRAWPTSSFDPDAPMDDGNPLGTPEDEIHLAGRRQRHLHQRRAALRGPRAARRPTSGRSSHAATSFRGVLRARALHRAGP